MSAQIVTYHLREAPAVSSVVAAGHREMIGSLLRAAHPRSTLLIDMASVATLSEGFARELLVEILRRHEGRVLVNARAADRRLIDRALRRHQLMADYLTVAAPHRAEPTTEQRESVA